MSAFTITLPAHKPNYDIRSDTATKPTQGMLESLCLSALGDAVFGEDPTVNELERRAAELCGKEAALFVASSTMSNQLGIRTHLKNPPESIIVHHESHIYVHESGGASFHSQAQMIPVIPEGKGNLKLADVEDAFVEDNFFGHHAPTHLICLENTMTGVIMPLEDIKEIRKFALEKNVPIHMDGSRLWNTSIATGISIKEYAQYVDSLNLCLSKGMGCPVGALLVGSKEYIEKARHFRKLFGGGWRQAGILAACGIYAIDNIWPTMKDTHERTKRLADGLVKLGFKLALPVQTNMVSIDSGNSDSSVDADRLGEALKEKNIIMGTVYEGNLRIVLHHQIDDACVDTILETANELFAH